MRKVLSYQKGRAVKCYSLLLFTFLSELCTYSNCLHEVGEQLNNYISDLNK